MIEERYLIIGPFTFILYQLFKPIGWLKRQRRWVQLIFIPYIFIFVLLDTLYNLIFGTFLFWELPREFLFTDRLKRWKSNNPNLAVWFIVHRFQRLLNKYDKGHL